MSGYQEFLKYRQVFHEYLKSIGKYEKTKYDILYEILYNQDTLLMNIKNETTYQDEVDIRPLYKKLILIHHPDKGGSSEIFIRIQKAYENKDIYTLKKIDRLESSNDIEIKESINDEFNMNDFWKTTDEYKWFHNIDREYIESKYMTTTESIKYIRTQLAIMLTIEDKDKVLKLLHNLIYRWQKIKDILPSFDSTFNLDEGIINILS